MASSRVKASARNRGSRPTMAKPHGGRRARQITVGPRSVVSTDPDHAYEARLSGAFERSLGATPEAALANLVKYHQEKLGIEVVVEE